MLAAVPHLPPWNHWHHWLFVYYDHIVAWQMRLKIPQSGTMLRLATMAARSAELEEIKIIVIKCTRTGILNPPIYFDGLLQNKSLSKPFTGYSQNKYCMVPCGHCNCNGTAGKHRTACSEFSIVYQKSCR